MASDKQRLDKILVDAGLCDTRAKAQGLILAGEVTVDGVMVDKPGAPVSPKADIAVKSRLPYVSRGGLKLAEALKAFEVPVQDQVCLDAGASTGGFTDCLLQQGASKVYAVDVGYGQLDWRLRQDARVVVYEKTHIRDLDPAQLDPKPTLAVADVSFISVKKVVSSIAACLAPGSRMLPMAKPQFEYRDYQDIPGFSGVVTDAEDHIAILTGLCRDLLAILPGWSLQGIAASPITGPKGNREFFLDLVHGTEAPDWALDDPGREAMIRQCVCHTP